MTVVAALITCHNRREKTLACLDRLFQQTLPPDHVLRVYLVDDGSTDATVEAVRSGYPQTNIIIGDGSLYWCNGMRLAWENAAQQDPNYYLWLNDDTMLYPGAIKMLLRTERVKASQASIVVGSCCDEATGTLTFGGWLRPARHPARCVIVAPETSQPKLCDTFNGNCVLVPRSVMRRVGVLRSFSHGLADIDYGLRATQLGIPILLAPGYLATCQGNSLSGMWVDVGLPRITRFRVILGRKGLPPADWWRFLWQHAGARALFYWPAPYARVLLGL